MKKAPHNQSIFLGKSLSVGWIVLWFGVGVIGLFVAGLTWRYVTLSDDGTHGLLYPQKILAKKAIDAQYATYLNPNIGNLIKNYYIHVDMVFPTSAADAEKYCLGRGVSKSTDPDSPQFYSVLLSVQQFFSFNVEQIIYDGCFLMDKDADGRRLSRP